MKISYLSSTTLFHSLSINQNAFFNMKFFHCLNFTLILQKPAITSIILSVLKASLTQFQPVSYLLTVWLTHFVPFPKLAICLKKKYLSLFQRNLLQNLKCFIL